MSENTDITPQKEYGKILDFFDHGGDERADFEIAIRDDYSVVFFHDKPFRFPLSWFEFDLGNNNLELISEDGEMREIGLPLRQDIAKYMQNAHQILTIFMDNETGEAREGKYIPLIIHKSE